MGDSGCLLALTKGGIAPIEDLVREVSSSVTPLRLPEALDLIALHRRKSADRHRVVIRPRRSCARCGHFGASGVHRHARAFAARVATRRACVYA